MLGVHKVTVIRWIRKGNIRAVRIGEFQRIKKKGCLEKKSQIRR